MLSLIVLMKYRGKIQVSELIDQVGHVTLHGLYIVPTAVQVTLRASNSVLSCYSGRLEDMLMQVSHRKHYFMCALVVFFDKLST